MRFKLTISLFFLAVGNPFVQANADYIAHDYDGDGLADVAVRRPATFYQYISRTSDAEIGRVVFGRNQSDIPVSGDFDGDGIADIAVRRPDNYTWYIKNSSDGEIQRIVFGKNRDDIPVPADYDGDGITDVAVRRASNQYWYIKNSSGVDPVNGSADGITRLNFGKQQEDIPVPADYDGDGKADVAVRRPSNQMWYIRNSTDGEIQRVNFGLQSTDIPVPADYDGDGLADIAVRRPGTFYWYIQNSSNGDIQRIVFGRDASDIPIPADYDGDGKADIAVRRPATFYQYILNSADDEIQRIQFGRQATDIPLAAPVTQVMEMLDTDLDDDGLSNDDEENVYGTDPESSDSDNDGLADGDEVNVYGTDPLNQDSDQDGVSDGDEISAGTDPLDMSSYPSEYNLSFSDILMLDNSGIQRFDVQAADFTGNGYLDVLAATGTDEKIDWFENLTAGNFSESKPLDSALPRARAIDIADLDGDGLLDVVAGAGNLETLSDPLRWYRNLGDGQFSAAQEINISVDNFRSVVLEDFDMDGDVDLAITSINSGSVVLLKNQGNGSFADETVITSTLSLPWKMISTDLDSDGDMDLLLGAINTDFDAGISDNDTTPLLWLNNNGAGSFTEQTIHTSSHDYLAISAGDYDGDGDVDIVVGAFEATTHGDNPLTLLINNGSEVFSAETVSSQQQYVHSAEFADLDSDGDMDIIVASEGDYTVAWYENEGNQFGPGRTIVVMNGTAEFARPYDMDNDGDPDIVITAQSSAELGIVFNNLVIE